MKAAYFTTLTIKYAWKKYYKKFDFLSSDVLR